MKHTELNKHVTDKVVEKYRSGLGYKKISETLNIPRSTIKSMNKKWKEYGTTTNLPREDRSTKLTDRTRRVLIREATKRPKITLKELQSSTAEIGISVHSIKKKIRKHVWCFAKRHVGDSPDIWKEGTLVRCD